MSKTPVSYIPICSSARSALSNYISSTAEEWGYESTEEFLADFGCVSVTEMNAAILPWSDFVAKYGNPNEDQRGDYYILSDDFENLFGDAQFLLDDPLQENCGYGIDYKVFYYSDQKAIGPI